MGETTTKLVRVAAVAEATGLNVREVWRKASSDPDFPRPRKLSPKVTVWVENEVQAWIERKLQAVR